tara:strand:+ start:66 stop:383 length:318 start_codon:yes stop_codon:yes gene_type:complete
VVQAVELLTMENHLHQVELVTHLLLVLHKEILEEILQTHNQELVVAVVVQLRQLLVEVPDLAEAVLEKHHHQLVLELVVQDQLILAAEVVEQEQILELVVQVVQV